MSQEGIEKALFTGVAAVVVKSTNETMAAKAQIKKADYLALDRNWQPVSDKSKKPRDVTFICRSGLTPQPFDEWLPMVAELDRKAADLNAYVIASLVVSDLDEAVEMSRKIEQAGVRLLEINIGTPYADEAEANCVSTERSPQRVTKIVRRIRDAVDLPLWVKLTGQSEQVDVLVLAAKEGGADSVVFPGRYLGMVPDVKTQQAFLGSNVGVGGFWNLPLSCYWIARTYRALTNQRGVTERGDADKSAGSADCKKFPLIGTNGARSGLDVIRFLLAGASAVETASLVLTRGYEALAEALEEIEAYLDENSTSATELIGRAAMVKTYESFPDRSRPWATLPIE